jgi:hypothetical protein
MDDDPGEWPDSEYLSMSIFGVGPNAFDGLLIFTGMAPDRSDTAIVSPLKNIMSRCSMGRLICDRSQTCVGPGELVYTDKG